ncbi:MAG: 4-vinyl reductase [Acaryochloridaceae cyanobacterium SU_2_1]|nr:4-vinyl reductase [Acaryochloridaceae cyanobacterium SU_2_1]NJM95031.1 4-vinyl reductase [Acaryochloridaceae cyanobacterium CSU_5_19]
MISVAALVQKQGLPGNLFASDTYIQGDMELGLIENRHGSRLLALPDTLLRAVHKSLEHEVGPAAAQVLRECGGIWGKNFYRRFSTEVSDYYGKSLAELTMGELIQSLQECWKTYGWGLLDLDVNYSQQGFLVVKIKNSAFAANETPGNPSGCWVEAGLLSAFFSQLSGRNLYAVQTACESMQAEENCFVLGIPERVKVAEAWLGEAHDHQTVMTRLIAGSADGLPG